MSKKLYHFDRSGNRHEVSQIKGEHYIATGEKVSGRVTSNPKGPSGNNQSNSPYHGLGNGEWDYYAHTSEDL